MSICISCAMGYCKKTIVEQLQSFFLSYLAFCQFNLTCGVAVFCFDCLFFDKIQYTTLK